MKNRPSCANTSLFTRRDVLLGAGAVGMTLALAERSFASVQMSGSGLSASTFARPPDAAKPWVIWWWLEGFASTEGISKDLEAMKRQGIAGVQIFDAGEGGPLAPKGPAFMGEGWRENFRHAVREAGRLGLEISVNLASGWDCGGTWVSEDDAIKQLVWSELALKGPAQIDRALPPPAFTQTRLPYAPLVKSDWYRDVAVVAYRTDQGEAWDAGEAVDVTDQLRDNRLHWKAPAGHWTVLRFGYTLRGDRIKNASASQTGWEIDPLSAGAMDRQFAATAAKLIDDAGPLTGKTLTYMHIDSWELQQPQWSEHFVAAFRARRGYDPLPYLAVLAKKTIGSAELSDRFQWDYRRTLADLVRDNYYGRLNALCKPFGLGTDSEAGGPFYAHSINALECQSVNTVPMAEFWANLWEGYRLPIGLPGASVPAPLFAASEGDAFPISNFGSLRQAASAAHIYGKSLVQAESFTNFNDDWTEDPFALKTYGDRAFCLGVNRLCIHGYVLQAADVGPGYQWPHVGVHLNRHVTWWHLSHAWLTYLARCSHMLQQGRLVADILYYSGEAIPNFVLTDKKLIAGHDFDEISVDALLNRAQANDGNVVLPGGLKYRYLAIPDPAGEAMSPMVLTKLKELVEGGVTLVASRPQKAPGLADHEQADRQVKELANALWGSDGAATGMRSVGRGRVAWGVPLEQLIVTDGMVPDVELRGLPQGRAFDWIHRQAGDAEIYFLANGSDAVLTLEAVFRVSGKTPELWDAVNGVTRDLSEFRQEGGRTLVPMRFEARQSFFVVFQKTASATTVHGKNFPVLRSASSLEGPWEVSFDPASDGPPKVIFAELKDWIERPEEAIRYYSGTATYRKTFDLARGTQHPTHIDLGVVKNLAQVRLNGQDLGVVWTAPWRVEVKDLIKAKDNVLEIEIVNLWPNRLIAEGKLPREQRKTVTNVLTYEPTLPANYDDSGCPVCEARKKSGAPPQLLSSGLIGPVTLLTAGASRRSGETPSLVPG